jgi:hypothetical protein
MVSRRDNMFNWSKVLDASNIFAVTGRGLFLKSTDGGDSWTITQAGAYDSTGGLNRRDLLQDGLLMQIQGLLAEHHNFQVQDKEL